MKIDNAVALVTGANRGIGLAFTRALLARGARKVYAGARDPSTVTEPGVEPIRLDVTKPDEVAAAAARARDVTLVINNAGIGQLGGFLAPDSEESARRHLETNFFGMLRMSHAFAPVLAANGGGALLNVLSIVAGSTAGSWRRTRPANRPPGRSPTRCVTSSPRNAPRCWRCTWPSSTPTSCARSRARRPAPTRSSPARSTGSRTGSTKCWPTNAPDSSSRA